MPASKEQDHDETLKIRAVGEDRNSLNTARVVFKKQSGGNHRRYQFGLDKGKQRLSLKIVFWLCLVY